MERKLRDFEVEKKPTSAAKCGFNRRPASYALAAKLPLTIRRHANLMGISLPMPTVGSLRSQHDEIMTKSNPQGKEILRQDKHPYLVVERQVVM